MGARHFDLVEINRQAVEERLAQFGMTAQDLSLKLGKDRSWIAGFFHKGKVARENMELIEDRLFCERGSLYRELSEVKEQPQMSEGHLILIKQLGQEVSDIKDGLAKVAPLIMGIPNGIQDTTDGMTEEIVKAVRESNAANQLLLEQILQKDKEICTAIARILSFLERMKS